MLWLGPEPNINNIMVTFFYLNLLKAFNLAFLSFTSFILTITLRVVRLKEIVHKPYAHCIAYHIFRTVWNCTLEVVTALQGKVNKVIIKPQQRERVS